MRDPRSARSDVVVVGGGVAAGACVSSLREAGYDGTVTVVCSEPHAPYTRPGLTKNVLRGEKPADAALWRSGAWYAEQSVELVTGATVTAIDPDARTVCFGDRRLAYGSLVLATGAEPRPLDFGAGTADRVHVLRTFADADAIRPHLGAGTRWLVIGGGFIGAEFAASAALTGSDVSLVMPQPVILEGAFGAEVGEWFDVRLRGHGVRIHSGTAVTFIERRAGRLRVRLAGGHELEVDHVVVGAGVIPSTRLAAEAGLHLALDGIAVSASLRTSASDIYAIGDVAAYESVLHGRRVRIEHWDVARAQGAHVAGEIMHGGERPFAVLPYFFGTLGDWAFLEYVGVGGGRAVFRGPHEGDDMSAAFLADDDVLTGLVSVGRPDDLAAARGLVSDRARLDPAAFADPRVPLPDCRRAHTAVTR
ncbi:MAG: 3-phenylpropionate/trans-cinnamate dioxygenase ferredoxin reductase component [Gaiellales bacterium]|nr:3-phenylpropionate/trans-cinnamate dioxygenase ferredoxin reductase component [Gaiellales bacterium]